MISILVAGELHCVQVVLDFGLLPQSGFSGSLVGEGAAHGIQILFKGQCFEDAMLDLVGAGGQQVDGAAKLNEISENSCVRLPYVKRVCSTLR